ncbi:hypothetical protein ACEUC3_05745 [Aeromonas bivalvium]|uniref:hypothetical protein n=1 Tax=Aeromonas bivalvium TaxID=440079 RepID=UPI0038D0DAD6
MTEQRNEEARAHALAEGSTFTWHELYVADGEAAVRMALIADPQGAYLWLFTPFPGKCQQA